MTDILTGSLAAFAGPNLVIAYPIEVDTGSDLDIHFWHVDSGQDLHVRLQAKRLNAAINGCTAVKIAHRSYNELLHEPKPGHYQFRTLRDSPDPTVALYLFYNHLTATLDPLFTGKTPTVSGINLAFASDVALELEKKLSSAALSPKKVLHHKRLSHLCSSFFQLEALLCPDGDWTGEIVPPPSIVSNSLVRCYSNIPNAIDRMEDADLSFRRLFEPATLAGSSKIGKLLEDGPSIRIDPTLGRPVITFISGRTDDSRTPIISDEHELKL